MPQGNKTYRYESVFAHASFQFCGHIDEYLIENTRRLCLFYCQPRFGKHHHVVRTYAEGKLVEERKIASSRNLFLYYGLWLLHHHVELMRFASRAPGRTLMMAGHPVAYMGSWIYRFFFNVAYGYWIGDYFPSKSLAVRLFERLKRFYHKRVRYAYYLTDAINRKFNGGVVRHDDTHRTVMWGVRPFGQGQAGDSPSARLMFMGLLRDGQGIDKVLALLAARPAYTLAIVGVAAQGYEKTIVRLIRENALEERVYFPNRFHDIGEVRALAQTCMCGMALYDIAQDNFTHYADPGKVKAYTELGLPVVMTRISDVVPHIERFKAGEIVDAPGTEALAQAVARVAENPRAYRDGVSRFNAFFDYRAYYETSFAAWEKLWP